MSDLIRRSDAIEAVMAEGRNVYTSEYANAERIIHEADAVEALSMLPSAEAVEVVRCKDCKHRYISGNGTTRYYVCDFMDAQYEDNGFCHHGERKGGNTDD